MILEQLGHLRIHLTLGQKVLRAGRHALLQILLLLLVGVENLQKGLVDVRLIGEAGLDLVDVVDGVAELHLTLRLVGIVGIVVIVVVVAL